jgi:hypothetical protein
MERPALATVVVDAIAVFVLRTDGPARPPERAEHGAGQRRPAGDGQAAEPVEDWPMPLSERAHPSVSAVRLAVS